MKLSELKTLIFQCASDLINVGIPIPKDKIVEIKVAKATSFWGQCVHHKKVNTFTIKINEVLFNAGDLKALKETIYHELIHMLPGCFNHGKLFKAYGFSINKHFGVDVFAKRKHSEEITKASHEVAKNILLCQHCKKEYFYARQTKIVENFKNASPERRKRFQCPVCKHSDLVLSRYRGVNLLVKSNPKPEPAPSKQTTKVACQIEHPKVKPSKKAIPPLKKDIQLSLF